jgi:hypothetical protein
MSMSSISNGLGGPIFRAPSTREREIGLTILRIAVGVIFMAPGRLSLDALISQRVEPVSRTTGRVARRHAA